MISWPAIIKFDGSDMLDYVESESEWLNQLDRHLFVFRARDVLIDAKGESFVFSESDQVLKLKSVNQQVSLEALMVMIRAHIAEQDICCVDKIMANSYVEAMAIVASFVND